MPLYSYRKSSISNSSSQRSGFDSSVNFRSRNVNNKQPKMTVGTLFLGLYNDFHKLMTTSRLAAILIPSLLVITGGVIIHRQVWPTVVQYTLEATNYFDQSTTPLVAGDYIQVDQVYSNPGSSYFRDLTQAAVDQNILFNDDKSNNYSGDFSLSIPSLDLYDLNVSSNVDSGVEEIYDAELTDGLAHFLGTSLPFSELSNSNVVIYGHSSAGDYYQRTKDPAAAFSVLSEIRYGSEIYVDIDGQRYTYKFVKGKIVDANDLSILEGSSGQKQLTLFTCYPNGNNGKRFVATARLIED